MGERTLAFFLTILFIAIGTAMPLAMMWSAGAFVGQRPPPQWAVTLIRYSVSTCLFAICAVAALEFFNRYEAEWWSIPASAIICGAGICGIVGVNTYKGD